MTDTSDFDQRGFRHALGRFCTGVTIVTAAGPDGPVGLTVSSFNAVSMDPPLVLWSLDRRSSTLPAFESAKHFAVNVLSADQMELSNRFASRDEDKFAGLDVGQGGQAPLLPGCIAYFLCRTVHRYDGGDHMIFVGQVEEYERRPGAALLFHDGAYCAAMEIAQDG